MRDLWLLHRRAVIIGSALIAGLMVLLAVTGVVVRYTHPGSNRESQRVGTAPAHGAPSRAETAPGGSHSSASADRMIARWDAMPTVTAAVSAAYPAIPAAQRDDPAGFAAAFATTLFTRMYASSTRGQLLGWVQVEDAPLRSPRFPARDWAKVLGDSLSDPTWDDATATPVPAATTWGVLASDDARDTVSDVSVRTDPQWESLVADGYQPADPLTTVQDVTLLVTRHTGTAVHVRTSRFAVSLAVQLGSAPDGGYGVAATNDFVSRAVA